MAGLAASVLRARSMWRKRISFSPSNARARCNATSNSVASRSSWHHHTYWATTSIPVCPTARHSSTADFHIPDVIPQTNSEDSPHHRPVNDVELPWRSVGRAPTRWSAIGNFEILNVLAWFEPTIVSILCLLRLDIVLFRRIFKSAID